MTVYQQEVELSSEGVIQCRAILHAHPIFSSFFDDEINDLASRFTQVRYHPNDVVVKQNEFVDSIYLIASGQVEVRVTSAVNHHQQTIPVALLQQGESIGLSETGFYSETGRRTATVVALSELVLFRLSIGNFSDFLDEHPALDQVMLGKSQLMLRMNFIKQLSPFSELSIEQLKRLAEEVHSKTIQKDDIIFSEGDEGHECYLIQSGTVDIFNRQSDDTIHMIAQLQRSAILGEAAILQDAPRNATAKALTDCQLLTISRELLQDIVTVEASAEKALMRLTALRSSPIRVLHVEHYITEAADGEVFTILKNTTEGKYFRLTKEGWFVWERLDGKHSIRDISLELYETNGFFNPNYISQLIVELEQSGFIQVEPDKEKKIKKKLPGWLHLILTIRHVMEARWTWKHVDEWVTTTYESGVKWCYARFALWLWAFIAVSGFVVFVVRFSHSVVLMQHAHGAGWLFLFTIPIVMTILIFHELAHAYTTKYYGRKVFGFGVGWLWVGPIAFCDTSDMWLNSPRQRVVVDLAGFYVQVILSGVATIASLFFDSTSAQLFLWYFALFNYLIIFANLTPLIELDGYYVLMDYFDESNLKESAVEWIVRDVPARWRHASTWLKHKPQWIYWLACIVYLILEFIIPYIVMRYLLAGLFGITNPLISLVISLMTVLGSVLGIWAEMRRKHYLTGA